MKKFLVSLLFVIVALGIVYSFVSTRYHIDYNAVVSRFAPPGDDIADYLPIDSSDVSRDQLVIPAARELSIFADLQDIGTPRVLAIDGNGVLLVSLTGEDKVIALPDKNDDGVADRSVDVLANVKKPHGIVFDGETIYVAETDRVARYEYDDDSFKAVNREELFNLPGGGRHFTRTIKILDGELFTSVGSSCDVCDEEEWERSSILVSALDGSGLRTYASGLRNTVFFDFDSEGNIWGSDMGRDFLGDNLPPDELNKIVDGGDYGWPFCYGQKIRDKKYEPDTNFSYCDSTIGTEFDYPAHVSPLGTTFIDSVLMPEDDQGDLLVSFHGSWNSSVPVGYKIVKIDIEDGKAVGMEDFISGFIKEDGTILGRPVDIIFGSSGELYISDDKAKKIYVLKETQIHK